MCILSPGMVPYSNIYTIVLCRELAFPMTQYYATLFVKASWSIIDAEQSGLHNNYSYSYPGHQISIHVQPLTW